MLSDAEQVMLGDVVSKRLHTDSNDTGGRILT
jgi:hypothetical protein